MPSHPLFWLAGLTLLIVLFFAVWNLISHTASAEAWEERGRHGRQA